jgi:hypothetical protein
MSIVEEKINEDISHKDSNFKRPPKVMDIDDMVFGILKKKVKQKAAKRLLSWQNFS